MLPIGIKRLGNVEVFTNMLDAIKDVDVVMMLRIQMERQSNIMLPSLREYARFYGLNATNVRLARPDAIVMHPGPMNRGVEISSVVADGVQNVILDQVENGVAVRMALLYLVSGVESMQTQE
jgi:aspartate carbamoyltransferase catalytic subunit